jgi:ABC-2 type transport system permease protein
VASERSGAASAGLRTSIYDLGYRRYDGPRLGRRYAVASLFVYSLWSIFGLGRSVWAKVFPFGLAAIALLPALILLGVAALAPEEFELAQPEDYYGFISIVLALFCAVAAPELIGRDQRHHTLTLYFSRALSRLDYAVSKLAALVAALFLVLVIPQVLLLLGNAVAGESLTGYLGDNLDLALPIVASSLLVAVFMAALSLTVAVQATRRAFSTGAVIAAFVIPTAIGGILFETLTGEARRYSLLISPLDLLEGAVRWIFSAAPETGSQLQEANLEPVFYLVVTLACTLVALALLYRRLQGIAV